MNPHEFAAFTPMHAIVVLVCAAITGTMIRIGRARTPVGRDRLRLQIGLVALIVQLCHNGYWMLMQQGSENQWPLHLCDLSGFVCVLAFLLPFASIRALLYYWGVGLSSLAFIIPVLTEGPAHPEFWSFWVSHLIIVGGGLYLVLADGLRPTWRHLGIACGVTIVYGIASVFINDRLGSNYMYTSRTPLPIPGGLSLNWPFPRLPLLGAAACLLMFLVHIPWIRLGAVSRTPGRAA